MKWEANKDPIYVHHKDEMPDGEHYAIIVYSSIYIPGDERSRTDPGHGYPESTEPVINYIAYLDKAAWEADIIRRSAGTEKFTAIVVQPATVETKVVVKTKVSFRGPSGFLGGEGSK